MGSVINIKLRTFFQKLFEALTLGYNCAINCCFNFLSEEAQEIFLSIEEAKKSTTNIQKENLNKKAKKNQDKINKTLSIIFSFSKYSKITFIVFHYEKFLFYFPIFFNF